MKRPTPIRHVAPDQHVAQLEQQLWRMEQDATAQADFRRIHHVLASAVLTHLQEESRERKP